MPILLFFASFLITPSSVKSPNITWGEYYVDADDDKIVPNTVGAR